MEIPNIAQDLSGFLSRLMHFSYSDYCETGPVEYGFVIILHLAAIIYILSIITREFSWGDRVWSLLPIAVCAHFLYHQSFCSYQTISIRQWIMFACVCGWGLRLTYNFFRKGGYAKGGQDYRWVYIRQNYHWILVQLLNLFFTSFYQLILIFWFSSPIYFCSQLNLHLVDIAIACIWVLLFFGEVIADEQQWAFQTQKYKMLKSQKLSELPPPYRAGFVRSGLWKYSRHPNFFCEITMWWVFFAWSLASYGPNYSGLGALLLNLLFLGSTALTERISASKYPLYQEYQKEVSMLIPSFGGKKKKA